MGGNGCVGDWLCLFGGVDEKVLDKWRSLKNTKVLKYSVLNSIWPKKWTEFWKNTFQFLTVVFALYLIELQVSSYFNLPVRCPTHHVQFGLLNQPSLSLYLKLKKGIEQHGIFVFHLHL